MRRSRLISSFVLIVTPNRWNGVVARYGGSWKRPLIAARGWSPHRSARRAGPRRSVSHRAPPEPRRSRAHAPDVVEPEAQQERLQPQRRIRQRDTRGIAGAAEIAKRFILDAGHVHRREIAGAPESREFDGVTPIGLHFVAGASGNQRRGDDIARQRFAGERAIQAVAARTGFVGEPQLGGLALQAADQFVEVGLPGPIAPTNTGGSALAPVACATAIESLWTSNPTNRGVDFAMADLREHNAAVHAALRLWPLRLTRDQHLGVSHCYRSHSV